LRKALSLAYGEKGRVRKGSIRRKSVPGESRRIVAAPARRHGGCTAGDLPELPTRGDFQPALGNSAE